MRRKAILLCALAFAGLQNCRTADPFVDFDEVRPGLARKLAGCYAIEFGEWKPSIDQPGGYRLPTKIQLTTRRVSNECYGANLWIPSPGNRDSNWCLYAADQFVIGWGGTFTGVLAVLHQNEERDLVGVARERNDAIQPDPRTSSVTLRRKPCEPG
jgi:hypothetical protein